MSEEIDRRELLDLGGKALQFHAGKPKMSGSQQVVEHPRDPDHSEPSGEVRDHG